jgi:glycosyltransferase involved in cell wall biosynthesis
VCGGSPARRLIVSSGSPASHQPPQGRRLRVLASAAQGPSSPGFRVRVRLLEQHLSGHGVTVQEALLFDDERLRRFGTGAPAARARTLLASRRRLSQRLEREVPKADAVLVQRQLDYLPTLSLERIARAGRRLVYDVDDAIWLDTDPSAGGVRLAWLKGSRRKAQWLARHADVTIAGNALLAEWLSAEGAEVAVVPSLVDPETASMREHEEREVTVVGWIGSPSTSRYLAGIVPALEASARRLGTGRLRFEVMGGTAPAIDGVDVRNVRWSESAERELLARMDIGVMPLPDTPWTRGKCAYKALQYMSAGVPVICDDVGTSAEVVGNELAGHVVSGTAMWSQAIVSLATDPDRRCVLGRAGRSRVQEQYSPQAWAPRIATLLAGPGVITPTAPPSPGTRV